MKNVKGTRFLALHDLTGALQGFTVGGVTRLAAAGSKQKELLTHNEKTHSHFIGIHHNHSIFSLRATLECDSNRTDDGPDRRQPRSAADDPADPNDGSTDSGDNDLYHRTNGAIDPWHEQANRADRAADCDKSQ